MPDILSAARVTAYCTLRLPPLLDADACPPLTDALVGLTDTRAPLPLKGGRVVYSGLSLLSGLTIKQLRPAHGAILPLLAAMARARSRPAKVSAPRSGQQPKTAAIRVAAEPALDLPARFDLALTKLLALHGDSAWRVAWALRDQDLTISGGTLKAWADGRTRPRGRKHWPHLVAIARRYGLAEDSLMARLSVHPPVTEAVLASAPKAMRETMAWHLPPDFDQRSNENQTEILDWISQTLGSGSTDYRRYLQARLHAPYALPLRTGDGITPPRLLEEIEALLAFKTTAFVPVGWQRNGVWNTETAAQKRVQLGQMFGALANMGVKPHALSLGLLVLPQIWDMWLRWREGHRGFLSLGKPICCGWRSPLPVRAPVGCGNPAIWGSASGS